MNAVKHNLIEAPSKDDCVFGRGRSFQSHPGNVVLHELVDSRLLDYRCAKSSMEKNDIISSIVSIVQEKGRFLKRSNGSCRVMWEVVSDADAKTKVGHTIRSRMRREAISNGTLAPTNRRRSEDNRAASSGLITARIDHLASQPKPHQDQVHQRQHQRHLIQSDSPVERFATEDSSSQGSLVPAMRRNGFPAPVAPYRNDIQMLAEAARYAAPIQQASLASVPGRPGTEYLTMSHLAPQSSFLPISAGEQGWNYAPAEYQDNSTNYINDYLLRMQIMRALNQSGR